MYCGSVACSEAWAQGPRYFGSLAMPQSINLTSPLSEVYLECLHGSRKGMGEGALWVSRRPQSCMVIFIYCLEFNSMI